MSYWDRIPEELQSAILQTARRLHFADRSSALQERLECAWGRWTVGIHARYGQQYVSFDIYADVQLLEGKRMATCRRDRMEYLHEVYIFAGGFLVEHTDWLGTQTVDQQKRRFAYPGPLANYAEDDEGPFQASWM